MAAAFERYLITPLTSVAGVHEVLLTATPLLFTGMAVAIAFRAGYWNIGAEGQFLLGAIDRRRHGLPDLPAVAPSRSGSSRVRSAACSGRSCRPC